MFLLQSFLYSDSLAFLSGLNHRMVLLLLFSHSVMSDALQAHGVQHARLPCPLLSPRVCSDLCPLSRWCHLTISSSVALFSSCPQSFPASGSLPKSHFPSGGQNTGASASASVLPMNIQGWFALGLTGLKGLALAKWTANLPQQHIPPRSDLPWLLVNKMPFLLLRQFFSSTD